MDDDFWPWFAGFWEGEGSIWAPTTIKRGTHIDITQAGGEGKKCLKEIRKKLGGNVHCVHPSQGTKRKIVWKWVLYGIPQIVEVLKKIQPHLRVRQKEVESKLQFLLTRLENYHGSRKWTPEEVEILKKEYRREGTSGLARKIGRSSTATNAKANSLGITKWRNVSWTDEERETLCRLSKNGFTSKDISKILNRSEFSIRRMRAKLGIKVGSFGKRAAQVYVEYCRIGRMARGVT